MMKIKHLQQSIRENGIDNYANSCDIDGCVDNANCHPFWVEPYGNVYLCMYHAREVFGLENLGCEFQSLLIPIEDYL